MLSYTGTKCPVCEKEFLENDDIVTCPICGAPYHRNCYLEKGACIFEDLHESGKRWEAPEAPEATPTATTVKDLECPRCGVLNHAGTIFCTGCGVPLKISPATHINTQQVRPNQGMPPIYSGMPLLFDPMGGINPADILDENITFGEISKVIQQNTQYFLPVFSRIQKEKRSKFNFSAFLFSGGWLLYRKQYKAGILFTVLSLLLYLGQLLTTLLLSMPKLTELVTQTGQEVLDGAPTLEQVMILATNHVVSGSDLLLISLPNIFMLLSLGLMLFLGFRGNHMYLKHCIKTVNMARSTTVNAEDYNTRIHEKGGINTSIVLCLLVCYFLISYLPLFL